MKAALIPPKGLEALALRSKMHLALPLPELIVNDAYVHTYKRASRGGDFLILDNGEAEGARVPNDTLLGMAKLYGATELVLPDVIRDGFETVKRVVTFLDQYKDDLSSYQLMAVPQGKTTTEVQKCIEEFSVMEQITTLGIPRHFMGTMRLQQARVELANWIEDKYPDRFQVHCLGVESKFLREIKWLAKYAPTVRSIDSSLPFNYAIAGFELTPTVGSINRPREYFTTDWSKRVRSDLVIGNINTFMRWASGTESAEEAPGSGVREVSAVHSGD